MQELGASSHRGAGSKKAETGVNTKTETASLPWSHKDQQTRIDRRPLEDEIPHPSLLISRDSPPFAIFSKGFSPLNFSNKLKSGTCRKQKTSRPRGRKKPLHSLGPGE